MNRLLAILFAVITLPVFAQPSIQVETRDLTNFYQTFDRVRSEPDSVKAVALIQRHYLDQGTRGLKLLLDSRKYKASDWYQLMKENPDYLTALRPRTLQVMRDTMAIRKALVALQTLYPAAHTPGIYFCVVSWALGRLPGKVRSS